MRVRLFFHASCFSARSSAAKARHGNNRLYIVLIIKLGYLGRFLYGCARIQCRCRFYSVGNIQQFAQLLFFGGLHHIADVFAFKALLVNYSVFKQQLFLYIVPYLGSGGGGKR
jgi:hypothetical protein